MEGKFKIGQKVCSAVKKESEPVIIEKEYFDEYSKEWYYGITYRNEFRYVPQGFLKSVN
jgi:hypothetical protein